MTTSGVGRALALAAAAVMVLAVAACGGGEPTTYGPTTAGPTKKESTLPPADLPTTGEPEQPTPSTVVSGTAVCGLFTTAEISERLGLPVVKGTPVKDGPYSGCVWKGAGKAVEVKGGRVIPAIVTITRATAQHYATYEQKITTVAVSRKASGIHVVRGLGDSAYAIGASVKGVPIWYGGTRYGDWMTAVEMSGANSKASVVAVTELLREILTRG